MHDCTDQCPDKYKGSQNSKNYGKQYIKHGIKTPEVLQ